MGFTYEGPSGGWCFDSTRSASFHRTAIPIYPTCPVRRGDVVRAWIFLSESGGLTWWVRVLRRGNLLLETVGSEALAPRHGGPKE